MKELQDLMPWTDLWSEGYINDPRSYKAFEHCMTNIIAKAGSIFQRIEMSDHYGADYKLGMDKAKDGTALAIIIMSALKAANCYPDGKIDIAAIIDADLKRRYK